MERRQPGPLGESRAERVSAVDVVAAVGDDEGDRRVELPGEEVAEQLAGRLVGPVGVLDDDEQRLDASNLLEQGVDAREEVGATGPVVAAGRAVGRIATLGHANSLPRQQPLDGWKRLGNGRDHGRLLVLKPAEDLREGQVGKGAVTEIEAVADDDEAAGRDGEVAQRQQEPGLANAGIAAEENGAAAVGVVDGG
jgi:hypothetical protein